MVDERSTPEGTDTRPGPDRADATHGQRVDPDPDPDTETGPDDRESAAVPPDSVVDEAERLTRLAREAVDDNERAAYRNRRSDLLAEYGYTARVREDETRDVLVCYPEEWVEDGTIRPEEVADIDRGIERPLGGPDGDADWTVVDEHNRKIVETVRERHGDDHAENVATLADFMGNHYAKPIDDATGGELEEFLDDYYPRNAWPTPTQRDVIETSVVLAFEVAGERIPTERLR